MMTQTERRRHPRSKPPHGLGLRCTLAEAPPTAPAENLAQRIIDISVKGIRIEASRRLPEGTLLHLEIVPPHTRTPVSVRGVVRWWRSFEEKGQEFHLAGLEFDRLVEIFGVKGGDPLLLEVLHDIRMTVSQLRLYPRESPQALRAIAETYQSVRNYLEGRDALSLARAGRDLLVNGQPLPLTGTVTESLRDSVLGLLEEARIRSLTFKKGLTPEELGGFLQALTHKFWDLREGREINRRLREERILRISVDEVQYVALGEGDRVIEDAARKLGGPVADSARWRADLERLLESAAAEGVGEEIRLQLLKCLLEKDPGLLERAGALPSGGAGPPAGLLDPDLAREILSELASFLKFLPPEFHPRIRRLGERISGIFRDERLREELAAQIPPAGPESGPPSPQVSAPAPAVPGVVRRAREIVSMNLEEKLEALAREGPALIEELYALGETGLVRSLATAALDPLSDPVPRRRQRAAQTLPPLMSGLEKHADEDLLEEVSRRLRTALETERAEKSYQELAGTAVFLADLWIRRNRLSRAKALIDPLRRHYQVKDENFPRRAELAYESLQKLAVRPGLIGLSERLRRGEPEAVDLVEALDAAAAGLLVREARDSETGGQRQQFARLLARLGRGGAMVLLEEIQKNTLPADLLRLMELVPPVLPADLAELALAPLLRHEAPTVRRKAAQILADQGYPQAGTLLRSALDTEKEGPLRAVLAEGLGRLRNREAVGLLCQILLSRQEAEEVRVAAGHALGRIGDPRAVPALIQTYGRREKGLTALLRAPAPAPVRASAARALAAFPGDREARETLRRAREDRDAAVRSAAELARYSLIQDVFGEPAAGAMILDSSADVAKSTGKFAGVLEEIPLDPLLRRLAAGERGGILVLQPRGGTGGRIHLDAGVVVAVEFENRPDVEAFHLLHRRREGYFLFLPQPTPSLRRVLIPVDSLLESAERAHGT